MRRVDPGRQQSQEGNGKHINDHNLKQTLEAHREMGATNGNQLAKASHSSWLVMIVICK